MLSSLFNYINRVTFFGIEESDSYILKFRKRVLNRTFFIIAFACSIILVESALLDTREKTLVPISIMIISVGFLIGNYYNRFRASALALSFLFPLGFLVIIILYGDQLKLDYTISFFIVLVLTLYDSRRIRIVNIAYLILIQTFSFYYTSHYSSLYSEYVDFFDSLIVLTATTFGLFILVFQFIRISKAYQEQQDVYTKELDQKNLELKDNIVEKEMLNDRLLEKTKELQKANDFLESYTYITSHDLKSPIRNISSFSELLQKKLKDIDNRDVQDYLDFINSGALQINGILDGIIENAQSNRSSLIREQIDCNELLDSITGQMAHRLELINGAVSFEHLPVIQADRRMLHKVFHHLIDNGLKYNVSDTPRVYIHYHQTGDIHEFSVTDNGIGIRSEYSEDIFKMFKKLHGINEFGGSGVGLALCRKIVELHRGKIWLDRPRNGRGSIFKFNLPAGY